MFKMVLLGEAMDENVIEVDHKKLTHVWAEDFGHKMHEGARGIWKPEGHA